MWTDVESADALADADFDRAWQWGWDQADVMIPFLKMALEPVGWDG